MPQSSSPQQQVIRIMCPNLSCQRVLAVPSHARGKIVRCRGCATSIRIPKKAKAAASAKKDAAPAAGEEAGE